jgi:KDO2-lipid IV(A) lauroyltransferase
VLALRHGAPLQIGFMVRQRDGTYEVTLEEIPFPDLSGYSEENVLELTRRHTAVLEERIRQYPDHWLWMHRRWKHTWENVQAEKRTVTQLHA